MLDRVLLLAAILFLPVVMLLQAGEPGAALRMVIGFACLVAFGTCVRGILFCLGRRRSVGRRKTDSTRIGNESVGRLR